MHYWHSLLHDLQSKKTVALMPLRKKSVKNKLAKKRDLRTYYLGDKFPNIYLTKREAECVFWLIQCRTISETGLKMGLSPRTVEFYIRNLKLKLDCKNKRELLKTIVLTTLFEQLAKEGLVITKH